MTAKCKFLRELCRPWIECGAPPAPAPRPDAPDDSVDPAQNSLYSAQQALVSARLGRLVTLVNLYRDLGGGWIEHTGDAPRPAEDIGGLAPHNDAPWDLLRSIAPAYGEASSAP